MSPGGLIKEIRKTRAEIPARSEKFSSANNGALNLLPLTPLEKFMQLDAMGWSWGST
jgi:hypothetical protein